MPSISKIRAGKYGVFGISAKQMAQAFTIDGLHFDGSISVSRFGICSTSAGTAGKLATTATTFALQTGTTVIIKFTKSNTASNPTLNVNGTGAKAIMLNGTTAAGDGTWAEGDTLKFVYDGTYWQAVNLLKGSANAAGRVKIDGTLAIAGEAADAAALGAELSEKQDVVPAQEGQYLGFDADGNAVAVTPDAEPINGSNRLATSGGIYQAILEQYKTETITNVSVASFNDGADNIPVKSMTVAITPVQAAGTPTPENPLPISGWTGANIVVSPTLDAQDGTTYPVSWQTEAGTVYGGTLRDNGNGTWTLTVTHKNVVLDGSEIDWQLSRAGAATNCFSLAIADAYCPNRVYVQCISSHFNSPPSLPAADARANTIFFDKFGTDVELPSYLNIGASSDIGQTVEDFKTWLASNNVTVVYLLTTPQAYPLTAESVKTLLGDNNIFADTGDVLELVYRADVELYIAKKLAEV